MSETSTKAKASTGVYRQPGFYEIRIQGHLADQWRHWFEGLTITLEDEGVTLLTGPVVDQAALHGFLKKVRDSGIPLLSVTQEVNDEEFAEDGRHCSTLRGSIILDCHGGLSLGIGLY
jgi:hypothetical protein